MCVCVCVCESSKQNLTADRLSSLHNDITKIMPQEYMVAKGDINIQFHSNVD